MWTLLKLLLNKNYWRSVFSGRLWRETWIAVRRAHKDRRSWRVLAQQLFRVLVPLAVLLSILCFASFQAGPAYMILIGMGVLSRLAFGGTDGRRQPPATLSLGVASHELHASPALRREIAEICLLHAVLADRAASERWAAHKVLPDRFEVITRRRHLNILREHGLYDRLRATERDLLLLPDGHWPEQANRRVELGLEPLRCLRWALRQDDWLPLAGAAETLDYSLAGTPLDDPAKLLAASRFVTDEDLAKGREAGRQRFLRFWAEGLHRGIHHTDDEERRLWAAEIAAQYRGKESEDFLVGAEIVSRVSDDVVRTGTLLSYRRWAVLEWIEHRLAGKAAAFEDLQGFYLADEGTFPA